MKYTLYALVSSSDINNYRYIGMTSQTLKERLRSHLKDKLNSKKVLWIKSEIEKLNLILIIPLIENISKEQKDKIEINEIKKYTELGFNLTNSTIGGMGVTGCYWDKNRRNKINKQRDSINTKISLANKGRIISYEMINDYTKDKSIPIMQFDRKGNFISEYHSINHASTITKISYALIRNCCINELYQTNGFIFISKHEFTEELLQSKISNLKKRWETRDRTMFYKKVNMYDLNGNFIKQYNSINDAVLDGYGHVGEVCSGKRKSTNNKIFKYEKE